MKKTFCLLLLFSHIFLHGQTCETNMLRTISGTVTDEQGETLRGIAVVIIDTIIPMQDETCCEFFRRNTIHRFRTRTTTDVNGKYLLKDIPKKAILEYGSMGFMPQRIAVENQQEINVVLKQDFEFLNRVYTFGPQPGQRFRCKECRSVMRLDPKTLQPISLNTANPNSIRISCPGSPPLMILDGVEITNEQLQKIDPAHIESVSILKGSDAIDLYGQKAADGVIVITTKDKYNTKK